jgi:hypothetical protein
MKIGIEELSSSPPAFNNENVKTGGFEKTSEYGSKQPKSRYNSTRKLPITQYKDIVLCLHNNYNQKSIIMSNLEMRCAGLESHIMARLLRMDKSIGFRTLKRNLKIKTGGMFFSARQEPLEIIKTSTKSGAS